MASSPPLSGRAEIYALLTLIRDAAEDAMREYEISRVPIPSLFQPVSFSPAPSPASSPGPGPGSRGPNSTSTTSNIYHGAIPKGPGYLSTLPLKKAIRTLEAACGQLCATLAPPVHTIVNRAMPHESTALGIVAERGVADALARYPRGLHVSELSSVVGIPPQRLARLLRLLATRHCFIEVQPNVFANNHLSLMLLTASTENSIVGVYTDQVFRAASHLRDVWKDPEWAASNESTKSAFAWSVKDEIQDKTMFEWFALHPEKGERFDRAMVGFSNAAGGLAAIDAFPWHMLPRDSTVCDVGGGFGAFSLPLSKVHPHLRIVLQDLEPPIERAKKMWRAENPSYLDAGRVSFVPSDFFKETAEPGMDIYYLRYILHLWSDEDASVVLTNVRKAMAPHSRILVHDYVLQHACPNADQASHGTEVSPAPLLPNYGAGSVRGYAQDVNMMTLFNGKERTISDMRYLGERNGLEVVRVWDLAELGIVEFKLKDAP
ncbi:S-adenosyl-L-methionine-dependent methyltransferase [Pterulicium gracile]|uniref:S-adenosyl-L-methionine-dependent methyltransferase n=1 Tax=Pterulicium gracile TaxID=1884261 RepID=A0A5C3QQ10_9AGAR|nr:S-adenosyl-L-methionine-dependent methyltransferase [Pterula gracilis]